MRVLSTPSFPVVTQSHRPQASTTTLKASLPSSVRQPQFGHHDEVHTGIQLAGILLTGLMGLGGVGGAIALLRAWASSKKSKANPSPEQPSEE